MLSNKPKALKSASTTAKPMAIGTQNTIKMPKAKALPTGFEKSKSLFKSENIKSSSVKKLHDFLSIKNKKNNKIK
jgi:hypothetical protein